MTVRVSVICTTFNHASYVRQAVDSLVGQQTSFDYKVIIHDDCSQDGTAEILDEYAKAYPERVVLIKQKENIYSKGLSYLDYVEPHLEGDYVAICEGDDYWVSQDKLQLQFDYMEGHPDCSLCVHSSLLYHDRIGAVIGLSGPGREECDLSIEDAILDGGSLYATNALFFKREYLRTPDALTNWGVGDYPRSIYFAMVGRVHYLPQVLSAYRMFAKGSWSQTMSEDRKRNAQGLAKRIDGLKRFDAFSDYVYHNSVASAIASREQAIHILNGDWAAAKKVEGVPTSEITSKNMLIKWLDCHVPFVSGVLRNIRWRISALRFRKI